MAKRKESTPTSERYETGNTHRRAIRKKPKGKYPIKKERKITKKKGKTKRKKQKKQRGRKGHQYACTLFVCCFLTFSSLCEPTTAAKPACGLLNKGCNTWGKHKTSPRRISSSNFPSHNCWWGANPYHKRKNKEKRKTLILCASSSLACEQFFLFLQRSFQ